MSRELLKSIIDDFQVEKFNRFFRDKSQYYAPSSESSDQYNDEDFTKGLKLGQINFPGVSDQLIVCAFEVTKKLTDRSGKKVQYDKGKKILKDFQSDAGIFIFYDTQGNFRFSLIYTINLGPKRDWNNFKRFTYFVSKEFTYKTFLFRIGDGNFSSFDSIKEVFSVEKVTKAFYTDIAYWYFWAVQNVTFPKDAEAEENGRNITVIRMITRLIFIWFMKEKGLINKTLFDEHSISNILKDISPQNTTYYKAILQNLFFATLNTKIDERQFRFKNSYHGVNKDYMDHRIYRYEDYFKNKDDMLEIFKDIPFLNGGLFDCLDNRITEDNKNKEIRIDGFTDKEVGLKVPNFLFFSDDTYANLNIEYGTKDKNYIVRGLINTLASYNFTIDENVPDDQEVALDPELLGKVFENLLASFNPETATTARKATGSYYTPREIVDYMVTQSLKEYFKTHLNDIENIEDKLDNLFSSSNNENPFPKDTLRIIKLIDNLRIVDPAVGSGAFPMGILNKLVFLLSKLDPDSILWKETQIQAVDESISDPNLKRKFKEQIEILFSEKNLDYGRKLYLIQNCIYGVDIQQIAIEIAKLRFFISLLVDEKINPRKDNRGIEPLPNLDFKLMQGNSLIELISPQLLSKTGDKERNKLVEEFNILKNEYFAIDPSDKEKKREEINSLLVKMVEHDRLSSIKNLNVDIEMIKNQGVLFDDRKQERARQQRIAKIDERIKELKKLQMPGPSAHFEWNIDFSEVFYQKDGFDIVIANPPYGFRNVLSSEEKKYFREVENIDFSSGDVAELFIKKTFDNILKNNGILTFIVPKKSLYGEAWDGLRVDYWKTYNLIFLLDVSKAFENVLLEMNAFGLKKSRKYTKVKLCYLTKQDTIFEFTQELKEKIFMDNNTVQIYKSLYTESFFDKIQIKSFKENLVEGNLGLAIGRDFYSDKPTECKLLKGIDIDRWRIKKNRYLKNKQKLNCAEIEKFLQPKVICQRLIAHIDNPYPHIKIIACYDSEGIVITNTLTSFNLHNAINPKFWLAYLNSTLVCWYAFNFIYSRSIRTMDFYNFYIQQIPIPTKVIYRQYEQKPFICFVNKILAITKDEDYLHNSTKQAKVREYEKQIDQMVYKLYGLTEEEIAIVEGKIYEI